MDLSESIILAAVIVLMAASSLASFLPYIPGPVLVWSVGALYAAFTGLERVTFWALLAMTGLMAVGSTADFWMQLFGVRMEGGSCLATLGSMLGGIIATFLIPIPVIGTLIGIVVGAWALELLRQGDLDPAIKAGKNAFKVYLLSAIIEFGTSILILIIFLLSLWSTV